jgi:hypothetical protein
LGKSRSRPSPTRRRPQKRSWGLLGRQASIGFERTVVIGVTAETIRVGGSYVVSGRLQRRSLTHFVVEAIDRQAHAWGPPPDSFYWVPSVQFVVGPDGQDNLNILKTELTRFGLPTRIRNPISKPEGSPTERR